MTMAPARRSSRASATNMPCCSPRTGWKGGSRSLYRWWRAWKNFRAPWSSTPARRKSCNTAGRSSRWCGCPQSFPPPATRRCWPTRAPFRSWSIPRGSAPSGLIVDRIVDIVEERAAVESLAPRAGVMGSFVTQRHVTDLLDLPAIVRAAVPGLLDATETGAAGLRSDSMASQQFCTFLLDGYLFGVPVPQVQEVIRFQPMTPVPLAPPAVKGMINLRGQIVLAIDLRRRLSLGERPRGRLACKRGRQDARWRRQPAGRRDRGRDRSRAVHL